MRCFASLSTLLYTNDVAGSLVKKEVGKRREELVYARVPWYLSRGAVQPRQGTGKRKNVCACLLKQVKQT